MLNAIIYLSQTGSAERYARMLSDALQIPAYSIQDSPSVEGKVLYVAWALQQKTVGLKKAMRKYDVAGVVQVGMSPIFPDSIEKGRERNHIPDGCAFFQVQGGYDEEKLSGIYKKSMKIAGQGIVARIEELGKERELSDQELAMHDMFVNGKGDPASWDISEIVSYF